MTVVPTLLRNRLCNVLVEWSSCSAKHQHYISPFAVRMDPRDWRLHHVRTHRRVYQGHSGRPARHGPLEPLPMRPSYSGFLRLMKRRCRQTAHPILCLQCPKRCHVVFLRSNRAIGHSRTSRGWRRGRKRSSRRGFASRHDEFLLFNDMMRDSASHYIFAWK